MADIVTSLRTRSQVAGAALALALLVGAVSGVSAQPGEPTMRFAMDRADRIALAREQPRPQQYVQECEAKVNLARDLSLYYVWQCVSAGREERFNESASTAEPSHDSPLWFPRHSGIVPLARSN